MIVQGPDGAQIEFPDGTPQATILDAMGKHYGGGKPEPKGSFLGGVLQQVRNLSPEGSRGSAPAMPIPASVTGTEDFLRRNGRGIATTTGAVVGGALAAPAAAASAPSVVGPVAIEAGGIGGGAAIGGQLYDRLTGRNQRLAAQLQTVGSDVAQNAPYAMAGPLAGKAVQGAARTAQLLAKAPAVALGATTGVGPTAIREAAKAGFRGGAAGEAFQGQLRGTDDISKVVSAAQKGVDRMFRERGAAYRANIAPVSADKTVLPFDDIEKAIHDVKDRGSYKGIDTNRAAAGTWNDINDIVLEWKKLDPKEYHTPEGLDALKRSIGSIKQAQPIGTPSRDVAAKVYSAITDEITQQAPAYAKVMADYEAASSHMDDLISSLSMGPKANTETTVRKLQSILRDDARSGYGMRTEFGRELESKGADDLFPMLAGQALKSPLPRGIAGPVEAVGGMTGLGAGIAAGGLHASGFAAAPLLAAASPRLVGEGAYYLGKGAGKAARLAEALRNMKP